MESGGGHEKYFILKNIKKMKKKSLKLMFISN